MNNRQKLALFNCVLLVALTAGCQSFSYTGALLEPPKPLDNFSLPSTQGGDYELNDGRGKITLVYFGYTYCPDICPATLGQVEQALDHLGDDAAQVQVLMVTVDPERDTLDQLRAYLGAFDPRFIGLRADETETLDAILADFGAFYEIEKVSEESAAGYLVSHTASIFVVDRETRLRVLFPYGMTAEEIARDLEHLLKE
jgi:protein SCO1/2